MTRSRGTDGSLLPSLPWTLSSLALSLLPHLQFLPIWVTGAFIACGTWRYVIETRRGALPSAWFRGLLALLCFLGVLASYGGTISGVGPGSALLAVMASLKVLETRRRRDQFVLLFIAIFLVMSSLLREQYLWSLPYLVAALVFIMTAWLRMSASAGEPFRQSFRTGTRLILYAAPLAVAMWVFFPRISAPFWAVPIDTSSGVTGLGDTMSPGDISSLSESNAVAFRVNFTGELPEPRDRYWRALVLSRFNGRSWSGSDTIPDARFRQNVQVLGKPFRYQITLEPTRQRWVPALELPWEWDLSNLRMGRTQELSRVYPVDQRIAYNVTSYPKYQAEANLDYMRNWYLDLPDNSNPRSAELALALYREAGSPGAYIQAVLDRFHSESFYYTLQPPALGNNPVDRFIFDTQRGFCEHYASAFTFLMRAAGVPARVVLGYQGGEINPMGDYMIVRQSDAHAWSEVWIEGQGWRRVDPTAAVAPERIELGIASSIFDGIGREWGLSAPSQLFHQLQLSWDALNAGWNNWILGYGPDKQDNFMQVLGMDQPTWRKMLLSLIGLVVALTIIISLFLMLRYRPPPRDRAALLYRRFQKCTGIEPLTGETPVNFAERAVAANKLEREVIAEITDTYLDARYGSTHPALLGRLEQQVSAIRL